jgi:hypothetical protein
MPAAARFRIRDHWRELKRGRPGRRFRDRYAQARRAEPPCGLVQRLTTLATALLLVVVGLFFAVFPGPAFPFFILAGALLATQSKTVARWMDALEVRARRLLTWLKRRWRRRRHAHLGENE